MQTSGAPGLLHAPQWAEQAARAIYREGRGRAGGLRRGVATAAVIAAWLAASGVGLVAIISLLSPPVPCDVRFPVTCQVEYGLWSRILAADVAVVVYLASLRRDLTRTFYRGAAGWPVHLGWTIATLGWLLYMLFSSLLGLDGSQPLLELVRLVPPLVLAAACFLQGTALSRPIAATGSTAQQATVERGKAPTVMPRGPLSSAEQAIVDVLEQIEAQGRLGRPSSPLPPLRTLTVAHSGTGSVTSSPGGIDCGPTCAARFLQGTRVVLTARPGPQESVGGWRMGNARICLPGPNQPPPATCTVVMDGDQTVSATFVSPEP